MSNRFLFCGHQNEKYNASLPTMVCVFGRHNICCVFSRASHICIHKVTQVIAIIRARRMFEILIRSQMTFSVECQKIVCRCCSCFSVEIMCVLLLCYRVSSSSVPYLPNTYFYDQNKISIPFKLIRWFLLVTCIP